MPSDWIEEYLSLTDQLRSPRSFRLWSAISTLSSVLERRVWTVTDIDRLYPNQYIILAGGPASGKTIMISFAKTLLSELAAMPGGIYLGPDNPNKSSFVDELEKSSKISINGLGFPMYSAMAVLCMELGVLLSRHDKDFMADLTHFYDNPPIYTSPRRVSKSAVLEAPTVNILAGATPDALNDVIPEVAWDQGFTSRFMFIYGTQPQIYRDMFAKRRSHATDNLKKSLKEFFFDLHGEFVWEEPAQDAIRHWFNEDKLAPIPTYGRLKYYNGRRNEHVMKLSMISAVSAGHGTTVTVEDFRRAQSWLFEAEEQMPDVFRAMVQKSDKQLLTDAHHFLYTFYSKPKREDRVPLKERVIWGFFEDKVPHDRIEGLVSALVKTGRIRSTGLSNEWIPNTFDKIQDP